VLDRHLLEGELRDFFSHPERDGEELRLLLEHARPIDLAEILPRFATDQRLRMIRIVDEEMAGTVLDEADDDIRLEIVEDLDHGEIADIVDEAPPDEAADLLGLLPEDEEKLVLDEVEDREHADRIRRLLEYEEDTAGGIMTTDYVAVLPDTTIGQALQAVRDASDIESVPYVYVLDDGRIEGVTSLRELIEADGPSPISEIMETDVVTVEVHTDQEEASKLVDRHDIIELPVIDGQRRMLGVVTFDDAMDILDEEAEEDIYRLAGTGAIERPMTAPIMRRVRVRLPWLVVTLAGTLATVVILKGFSATLEQKIAFALFIPVMAAMCGNIAMQSTAMLIRGFATGEVNLGQTGRILLGELLVGLALGTLCGVLGGALAALMFGDYVLGIIVAVSMDLGMILAIVVGTAIPMLLVRFRIDPAVASGPFVTTLNDITGLTTYVATASLMLHWFPAT